MPYPAALSILCFECNIGVGLRAVKVFSKGSFVNRVKQG